MTDPTAPNGLAVRDGNAVSPTSVPTAFGLPTDFADQMRFAEIVAKSDLVDKKLQGRPENVFMVVQKAHSLNISFDLAVSQTHVIDNKVSPSAELLRILLRRAGHDLEIYEHNDKVAKARLTLAHRPDRPIEMEYSIAKAQAASLTNKPVWKQHAESMLVAAVTRLLVRFHCPEVATGLSLDVEHADAEFGVRHAEEAPTPVRAEAQRVNSDADGTDAKGARAKAVLEEALNAQDVATLTRLGKEARGEDLLGQIVGDDSLTLKTALMNRLHELEADTATTS
jgi:hypothetical protein